MNNQGKKTTNKRILDNREKENKITADMSKFLKDAKSIEEMSLEELFKEGDKTIRNIKKALPAMKKEQITRIAGENNRKENLVHVSPKEILHEAMKDVREQELADAKEELRQIEKRLKRYEEILGPEKTAELNKEFEDSIKRHADK